MIDSRVKETRRNRLGIKTGLHQLMAALRTASLTCLSVGCPVTRRPFLRIADLCDNGKMMAAKRLGGLLDLRNNRREKRIKGSQSVDIR